jgi:tetratricopeptide (TPR) repeat protein
MRTTFYIHIGVHKTGTKSIQHTFSENRDKLLTHGINYLPGEPNHGPNLISLLSDYPHEDARNIRRQVDTPEKAASYNASTRYEITKALARNRSPKMVISGEGLSGLSEPEMDRLKQMLGPYAAAYRIIVYVRDPYEYYNSASLQRLKSGGLLGARSRKIPLPNYRRKLERHIRSFGRENIDIRIFDPRRFVNGDLVSDFLVALGESPQLAQDLNIIRSNQAMSHEAAMILSETNAVIPTHVEGRANRARASGFHTYVTDIEGEKFTMDPARYLEHEAEIMADIEWLNQTIGEPVFGRTTPRPPSVPRWGEETVRSIKKVVSGMALELQRLEKDPHLPPIPRPALPAELEWLREAYGEAAPGHAKVQSAVPHFDQAMVRALGCFLHAVALTIQHMKAARFARRGRLLIWVSPRRAENYFREVVRSNPASADAQYRLSQAHLLRGHVIEARRTAEAAAQLAPDRALYARWLRLVKAAERWLFKPPPAPAEPVQRKRRHVRPVRTKKTRADRQAARRQTRAKVGQAASRHPPQ